MARDQTVNFVASATQTDPTEPWPLLVKPEIISVHQSGVKGKTAEKEYEKPATHKGRRRGSNADARTCPTPSAIPPSRTERTHHVIKISAAQSGWEER